MAACSGQRRFGHGHPAHAQRELQDFSLIDSHGRAFGPANLRGHWSLMFFGYTNCPDFCPTTLTTLAAMQKRLRAAKSPVLPQVIFVSVDAKRDTPAQLAKYVPYFDPGFIGLTAADQPRIAAVAKNLGVAVVIQPAAGDGNYTVDHSGAIFVLSPDVRHHRHIDRPFHRRRLARRFPAHRGRSRQVGRAPMTPSADDAGHGGNGSGDAGQGGGFAGRLFVWLQYLLPQHGISRLILAATRVRAPWFKNAIIRGFLKLYDVDMGKWPPTATP
jgi:protein SCO1/2